MTTRLYMDYTTKSLFEKDGKTYIRTPGVDMGGGGQPVVVYQSGPWAVVKEPGAMAWSGNFTPSMWNPTSYAVVNLETWEQDGRDIQPRKSWRQALKTMKARVDTLAEKTDAVYPPKEVPNV